MNDGSRDRQAANLSVASDEGERRAGLRAAGIAATRVAAPIIARRGGGVLGRLKAEWAAIVGRELAAASWPASLGRTGVLKLRVAPGVALDLQHRAPLVIERINLFFGRPAVARLVLVQGPLPLAAEPAVLMPTEAHAADRVTLDQRLAGISDPALRAALVGLGELVLGGERNNRR